MEKETQNLNELNTEEIPVNGKEEGTSSNSSLTLEQVIAVCQAYLTSPLIPETRIQYTALCQSLIIKPYLPMKDKTVALWKCVNDSDKVAGVDSSVFTSAMEVALCFDVLLAYTNIYNIIPFTDKTFENYDIIYQSGLADYILQFCWKDYERTMRMMERTISYDNLQSLIETCKKIDLSQSQQLLHELEEMRKDLQPDTIHDLASIMQSNDPMMERLKTSVIKDPDSIIPNIVKNKQAETKAKEKAKEEAGKE